MMILISIDKDDKTIDNGTCDIALDSAESQLYMCILLKGNTVRY